MDSPPIERIRDLVFSLATDETRAAQLVELIDRVSDPSGNAVTYCAALKAMSLAFGRTSDFAQDLEEFRTRTRAAVTAAGTIG